MNINNKYSRMKFYEEPTDAGGGGFAGEAGGEPAGGAQPTTTVAAPAAAPAPMLDASAFAKEFGGVIAEQFKKNAPAPTAKVYTPEEMAEARKKLNFWEPDDAFVTEFGNLETQKAAFGKLRDGLFNQFTTVVQALLDQREEGLTKRFDERLTPLQALIEKQTTEERQARFHSAYPELNNPNPQFQAMLGGIASHMEKAGAFKGKSESESFDIFARGVEEVVKQTNPDFKLGERKSSAPSNERRGSSIPTTSSGSGGGGSGGSSGGGSKLPIAAQILGPVRTPAKK